MSVLRPGPPIQGIEPAVEAPPEGGQQQTRARGTRAAGTLRRAWQPSLPQDPWPHGRAASQSVPSEIATNFWPEQGVRAIVLPIYSSQVIRREISQTHPNDCTLPARYVRF